MGMSDFYGPADRGESIATIHAALDAGITLLDTGDFYGMGHNEMLIREALSGRNRDKVQISVKFGALRTPDRRWLGYDSRPPRSGIFSAIRCSGSASIVSISTARRASTPTYQSRRPSARWPTW
jgi:aryl-alcohol dehydrogenase-like predicted oxidoreductase